MKSVLIDIAGRRFGRWVVKSKGDTVCGKVKWNCVCDCGASSMVDGGSLGRGVSTSCGCQRDEETARRNFKHGVTTGCHTAQPPRTYNCWRNMKARCQNPKNHKYPIYGGRGISVCEKWQTFAGFFEDMGECPPKHSIDRINNDGNYEPGNCRWAGVEQQMSNQSTNNNLFFDGRTMTIAQWSRETGIASTTILQRISRSGWSVERALTEKVQFGPRSVARN